jgi:glycine cleavage system H protein
MAVPTHLNYTAEHEWVDSADPGLVTVGITSFAAEALGDVVYVDLPEVGSQVKAGEPCGEIESTKSVSDLYAPLDGEVAEVNDQVVGDPTLVNTDSYGAGWLFRLAPSGGSVPPDAELLTPEAYTAITDS